MAFVNREIASGVIAALLIDQAELVVRIGIARIDRQRVQVPPEILARAQAAT